MSCSMRCLPHRSGESIADRIDLRNWVEPGNVSLKFMVGLPVEMMIDRDMATGTLKAMRKWMVGEHTFEVNDRRNASHHRDVTGDGATCGAFFAWGFDDRGIGYATRATSKPGRRVRHRYENVGPVQHHRRSRPRPVHRRRYRRNGSCSSGADRPDGAGIRCRWDVVARGRHSDPQQESHPLVARRSEVDLAPLVEQALARATAGIVDFLDKKWGKGSDFAYILFTGGGVETLKEALRTSIPLGRYVRFAHG